MMKWNGKVHEPCRDNDGEILPPKSALEAMHVAPSMIESEPRPLEVIEAPPTIKALSTSSSSRPKTPPLPLVIGVEVMRVATLPSLSQLEVTTLQAALKLNDRLREVGAPRLANFACLHHVYSR